MKAACVSVLVGLTGRSGGCQLQEGPSLEVTSQCEKRVWVLLLLLLLLPFFFFLSGRHLGNDHSKFNHSWGVRGEGGRAETVIHMFYLFVQSHGHPIVCPSFCHFRPLGPTPTPAPIVNVRGREYNHILK